MSRDESSTDRITRWLHRAGLNEPAAFLLEAVGPLLLFGAQVAFLFEPLFGTTENSLNDLAQMLEDPAQVTLLVENLRAEGKT
ncbi:MAG: hypothetical protein AMJ88_05060 [Anaerolineae bacterium SM23_ 63]|nr:MAG: hypothetical protein AMJ88_05060 [Anaerolineae bacterium SM23_ 63]HEY46739.1 hypothetical protein [Anaerolineae bacterium]